MKDTLKLYHVDEFGVKNYKTYYILVLTVFTLYLVMALFAVALQHVETGAIGANIHSYGDAFWALQISASTIGYGDFYPVTLTGRVLTIMMFYIGVGMMSFIGAQFINKFFGFSDTNVKNRELRKQNKEILDHNKILEKKIDTLVSHIEKVISDK